MTLQIYILLRVFRFLINNIHLLIKILKTVIIEITQQ